MTLINKAVFRSSELRLSGERILLDPPQAYEEFGLRQVQELPEEPPEIPEYTGPTAEELRQEAEQFRIRWQEEREAMIQEARDQADGIMAEARRRAEETEDRAREEGRRIKEEAEREAEELLAGARQKAGELEAAAQNGFEQEQASAMEAGLREGREAGYAEGRAEADRLIERLQTVLERARVRREDILAETEQQIVDLALLIARKVVKIISETQAEVVQANVKEALRKLKGRGDIIIRVNLADLKLATEHADSFIKKMEGRGVQIAEDSTVDPGGCIIETDFGEIDARISSQLAELERKIRDLSPIVARPRDAAFPAPSQAASAADEAD